MSTPRSFSSSTRTLHQGWNGLINAYRPYLPVSDLTPVITLNEGN
ncbi:MAG: threonine synthase, partial [Leptolyngbya sp. SIO1D8]|nr:threonine synthase [Leptolyngbya sp. SIO1D8]